MGREERKKLFDLARRIEPHNFEKRNQLLDFVERGWKIGNYIWRASAQISLGLFRLWDKIDKKANNS